MRISEVPLTRDDDRLVYVPVTLNGHDVLMLLDTGGFFSEIRPGAAASLDMPRSLSPYGLIDVYGRAAAWSARANGMTLGTISWRSADFLVLPPDPYIRQEPKHLAGTIAPNMLRNFDVDLDFGADTMSLMSPDHCPGQVIYWNTSAVAVEPFAVDPQWRVEIPVELDGKTFQAMIDTGAARTTLYLDRAEAKFGKDAVGADTRVVRPLPEREGAYIYEHRFKSLSFNGVGVANPKIDLVNEYDSGTKYRGHTITLPMSGNDPASRPDMLIGMDILSHFHLYIAYKEQKLYITQAK